jgi:hypothetical protein
VTTGASLFLLVMATVLAPCQAILKTTALDVDQWLLCAAVALSIIAVTEIRKAFLRQTVGPVRLRRSPRRLAAEHGPTTSPCEADPVRLDSARIRTGRCRLPRARLPGSWPPSRGRAAGALRDLRDGFTSLDAPDPRQPDGV